MKAAPRILTALAVAVAAVLIGGAAGGVARDLLRPASDVAAEVPHPSRLVAAAPTGTQTGTQPGAHPPAPVGVCAANTAAQWVLVDVSDQHAWLCAGRDLVLDTPVTTGRQGADTPLGDFVIDGKTRDTVLYPTEGGAYPVRYWITFDAPAYGFHDSAWQSFPYGSEQYRSDGSLGCVHTPPEAIAFLYDWVQVGAAVQIRA